MRLEVTCRECGKANKAPHYETNRTDYAKRYGADFDVCCRQCEQTNRYEVDDIKAIPQALRLVADKVVWGILLILSVIFIVGSFPGITPFFWVFLAVPLFEVVVEGVERKRDRKRADDFNRHKFRK